MTRGKVGLVEEVTVNIIRGKFQNFGKEISDGSNNRDLAGMELQRDSSKINSLMSANLKGYTTSVNMLYELNDEDNVGLQLEEGKRRRIR